MQIHNNFAIAYQILDDLKDIKIDAHHKQINYVQLQLNKSRLTKNQSNLEKQIKEFYLSGLFKRVYSRVLSKLETAVALADSLGANAWSQALQNYKN